MTKHIQGGLPCKTSLIIRNLEPFTPSNSWPPSPPSIKNPSPLFAQHTRHDTTRLDSTQLNSTQLQLSPSFYLQQLQFFYIKLNSSIYPPHLTSPETTLLRRKLHHVHNNHTPYFSHTQNLKTHLETKIPNTTCNTRLPFNSLFSKRELRIRGLSIKGCSTSPFIGRVGSQWREGNSSLLSFGVNNNPTMSMNSGAEQSEEDSSSQFLSAMLPFVVAATAVAALAQPATFTWVSKDLYAPALGGIMLSIGIKLSIDDFALAVKRPLPLSIGFIAQYVLKPALGVLIATAFGVPRIFYAGFVLTACVAGAQLSSYASFLSKGDVALSILLTSSTTIASVIVTPILTGLLIGSVVPVDAVAMAKSILQVVLAPVTIGLVLNTYAKPVVTILRPVMPFVAMICTSLCIGSPLAINQRQILSMDGLRLIFPVLGFHAVAFTVGYWISKIPSLRQEEEVSKTLSLCTGMQSSTLAGLLASQFLGSSQAVPPACSVVAMAIMGLFLASFWGTDARIRDRSTLFMPQTGSAMKAS